MKADQLKPSTWQRARIPAPEERLRKFCGMMPCLSFGTGARSTSAYVVEKLKGDRQNRAVRRYLCAACAAALPEALRPLPPAAP